MTLKFAGEPIAVGRGFRGEHRHARQPQPVPGETGDDSTLAIDLPQALSGQELRMARMPRLARIPVAAVLVMLLLLTGDSGQPFIYFQF